MKKRRESDLVRQRVSTRRALSLAQCPRPYCHDKSGTSLKRAFGRTIVPAPVSLSFFDEAYDPFAAFLKRLNAAASNGRVLIDMQPVKSVKTAALLVLYATIERLQSTCQDKLIIKTTCCSSKEVSMVFRTYGIWNLTSESRTRPAAGFPNSLSICTMSNEAHRRKDQTELRKVLKYTQNAILQSDMDEGGLLAYNAITESISNVWQHAYDDSFFATPVPDAHKNWWIIVQHVGDQFFIAVYDMGAGIPATISKKPWAAALIESISAIFDVKVISSPDAKSIKAAVDYGKSRFKLDNRGKGLTEAKDFVQRNPEGSLLIYSGLGHYEYKTQGDDENLETLSSPFWGTLIQWNLMLEKKDEAENHD
ncbi:hypothetical protein [Pseudomonas kermanshahensis]|uniref:hypothetical protein n=1 Tax=Pseudomonas kermanshahensis TaxID=2745482 RepID=UPI002093546F|nr:hypothetical protein [Pseudomonas kermanshahensis]USS54892.1 hypothetical protein NG836_24395 [Pseudomonas kermanshahensis]